MTPKFQTTVRYHDRHTKAKYVWQKYQSVLEGARILDVGADECHLRQLMSPQTSYVGVGLGGSPDIVLNLEKQTLPFEDLSFGCVLCLDVLEHVDNPHHVFDELCRVSRRHVIISLPNPWAAFWGTLTRGSYSEGRLLKFYGLPEDPPEDRHKWFFSPREASEFIRHRAQKNGFEVMQVDYEGKQESSATLWHRLWQRVHRAWKFRGLISSEIPTHYLTAGTMWAVLARPAASAQKAAERAA